MKKDIKERSGLTVGVDLGDRWSRYCVLDEQGQILEEDTVATTGRAFGKLFSDRPAARVVIEVGTHSPWVQRLLEELGHETITANPRYVRLIYSSRNKNDKLDAERLARLARVDTKLLHPIQHRGGTAQADRALLRSRNALVECRTKLINHARGIVKSIGGRLPRGSSRRVETRLVAGARHARGTDKEDPMPRGTDRALGCQAISGNRASTPGLGRRTPDVVQFCSDVGGSGTFQEQPCGRTLSGAASEAESIRRVGPGAADHESRRHGPAASAGRLGALHPRTVRTRHRSPTLGTRPGGTREKEREEACSGRRCTKARGVAAPTVGYGRGLRTSSE